MLKYIGEFDKLEELGFKNNKVQYSNYRRNSTIDFMCVTIYTKNREIHCYNQDGGEIFKFDKVKHEFIYNIIEQLKEHNLLIDTKEN